MAEIQHDSFRIGPELIGSSAAVTIEQTCGESGDSVIRVLCITWSAFAAIIGGCQIARADAPGPGDPQLVALVEDEYVSTQDFLDRLVRLEQTLAERQDPRAVFAAMYVVLTRNALVLIEQGHFDDGEWVGALMVAFGNLYRQAFLDFETRRLDRVPEPWRVTFEAADDITVFQHALLGVHTHINRDLAYAIAEVTPPRDRARRYADFVRTNEFVVAFINEVEDAAALYDADLAVLDDRLGELDERLLDQTLSFWRFRAWRIAAALDDSADAPLRRFLAAYLDFTTGRQARFFRDSPALFALGDFQSPTDPAAKRRGRRHHLNRQLSVTFLTNPILDKNQPSAPAD